MSSSSRMQVEGQLSLLASRLSMHDPPAAAACLTFDVHGTHGASSGSAGTAQYEFEFEFAVRRSYALPSPWGSGGPLDFDLNCV
jgi:hypothetical protein